MVAAASSAARGGTDTQASVTHVLQEQNLLVQSHAKQDRLGREQRARGTMVGGHRAEPQPHCVGVVVRKGL